MKSLNAVSGAFSFNGSSYEPTHDEKRLTCLFQRVLGLMLDGQWRTLQEIQAITSGSEAGISARLRDFRKEKFGGYRVQRRRRGNPEFGVFEYKVLNSTVQPYRFNGFGQGEFI